MYKIVNIVIIFILFGCTESTGPFDSGPTLYYTAIPNSGTIGQQIKIIDNHPDSLNARSMLTFLGVGDWIGVDSVVNDTMYVIIPFTAVSGPIGIGILDPTDPESGHFGKTDSFYVIEESPDYVAVKWSDLNYHITEDMSRQTWNPRVHKEWQVQFLEDTIKLNTRFFMEEIGSSYSLTLIDRGPYQLPQFVEGIGIYLMDVVGEDIEYPLERAILKIEHWDTTDRIVGRLFGIPWTHSEYCFNIRFN